MKEIPWLGLVDCTRKCWTADKVFPFFIKNKVFHFHIKSFTNNQSAPKRTGRMDGCGALLTRCNLHRQRNTGPRSRSHLYYICGGYDIVYTIYNECQCIRSAKKQKEEEGNMIHFHTGTAARLTKQLTATLSIKVCLGVQFHTNLLDTAPTHCRWALGRSCFSL